MNSIQFAFLLLLVVASVYARGHGGHSSGSGESGEHGGKNCTIVLTGTTNCTGVTGPNCTDQANLLTILNAGTTTALICRGRAQTPVSAPIEVELGLHLKECRGRCTCFTVAATETRNCTALQADTTFVKNSCTDQPSLRVLLAAGLTAKVCLFRQNVLIRDVNDPVNIFAEVEGLGGHH